MTWKVVALEAGSSPPVPMPPLDNALELPEAKNPIKFSEGKKLFIVGFGIWFTANSALGSSLPSGAMQSISDAFSITNDTHLVLLNSLFLVGFAIGPLILGPLSEYAGRYPVFACSYSGFTLWTMCCALSPNFSALLIFRLLAGTFASASNAVIPGLYADIYDEPLKRGQAMAYFMTWTTIGSHFGPLVSGFSSKISWRVTFWIGFGLLAVGLPAAFFLPETYAPVIQDRLQKTRIKPASGSSRSLEQNNIYRTASPPESFGLILTRPLRMLLREPIVLFTSLYVALIYSVLYLFFQAYPIIFHDTYDLSNGIVGLAFLPVAGGSIISLLIFTAYSSYHARAMEQGTRWALRIESRRLPLACIGGPGMAASLFWLGWTANESINPAVPIMSGLLFGMGYLLILMAMLNYLSDAYKQLSASAQSAASTTRSIFAVCLPIAARPMYAGLSIPWACSLLGFISLAMAVIPFIFIRFGSKIREKSSLTPTEQPISC